MRYPAVVVVFFGLLVVAAGCGKGDGAVAELLEHRGEVDRDRNDMQWGSARDGDRFLCEHGLRTGEAGWARLKVTAGGNIQLKEDTFIRFACAKRPRGLHVEFGASEIVAPDEGGDIEVDIGLVTMSPRGQYRVSADERVSRFEVMVGTAVVRRPGEPDRTLEASQGLELDIGTAVVRPVTAGGGPDAAGDPVVDAGIPDSGRSGDVVRAIVSGSKNMQRAPGAGDWQALPAGEHELLPGTGLRLGKSGTAELLRGAERAEVAGPAEVVVAASGDDLMEARSGSARLHATATQVRIRVPGGVIVARKGADAGTRARVEVGKEATRVLPESGVVDVAGEGGASQALELGMSAVLGRGGVVDVRGRPPAHRDVELLAGESVTIHDPRPPVAVAVEFSGRCEGSGEAVVEVAKSERFTGEIVVSKGRGRAHVSVAAGAHHYRVRCLVGGLPEAEPVAGGRLWVLRDDGTKKLADYAPQNLIDTDGRRYTVLYKNRLPEIIVRWPRESGPGPYELHVVPQKGQARVFSADGPRVPLRAGELGEGTYDYFFKAGSRTSRTSVLRIAFDNAAPSAYLSSPAVDASWSGSTVHVAGAALGGFSVSVAGAPVELDAQGRFAADVAVPNGTLAVKIAHPRRGIHYYLRRRPSGE